MINGDLTEKLLSLDVNDIISIILKGALILYAVFAFILVRQVDLRNKNFKTNYAPMFKILTIVHFLVVCFTIFLAFTL